MTEPAWMKYVNWPPCDDCDASGVRVCKTTDWPEECPRCKKGRARQPGEQETKG